MLRLFWEDNKGADRYLRWPHGKGKEFPGSCTRLRDGLRIIGQIGVGLVHAPTSSGYIYLIYLVSEYGQRGLGILLQHAELVIGIWGASKGLLPVIPINTAGLAQYKQNAGTRNPQNPTPST